MADSISRSLRDGSLEGEHSQALIIKDSLHSPLGSYAFDHFLCNLLSNITTGKSQSRGLVLVAFSRSPSSYLHLLRTKGFDTSSLYKWVRILDCYSDPLGWKDRIQKSDKSAEKGSIEQSVTVFKDARDVSKLFPLILDLGKGFFLQGKPRFAVAIDSVSAILRYASLPKVAGLISNLRSCDQISCIFWLIHSDLHEHSASAALEYISTMVASLEPMIECRDGVRSQTNLYCLEQNFSKGKFHVRMKRRNGRVKVLCEEFHMDQIGIKFAAVSSESLTVNQNLVPKVQFNLQLSEKERVERAKVVLPFEHQGNGETIQIYDGRRPSLSDGKDTIALMQPSSSSIKMEDSESNSGKGEILYFRDSDEEEAPDSDEDPDDDLDI